VSAIKRSTKMKRKSQLPRKKGVVVIEKRKQPRFNLELPLDYLRVNENENYGGIVANASELGVLVYLPEKMEMGTTLSTEIFYANGLKLDSIKAIAKVVWADMPARKTWGEYRYGLQFQSMDRQNLGKLKNLFKEVKKIKNPKGKK
jgi:hypothetical protein